MELDLGNLVYCFRNAIPDDLSSENLMSLAREAAQELANKLWDLPTEKVEGVVVAKLPDPSTKLPREKPLPTDKPETKWEKFAKMKGIQKKKKGRLIWDDELKKYVPRWGFNSAENQKQKEWMMEVPDTANPYEDQFAKNLKLKKERVAKNELQRLRNIARNSKGKVTGVGMMPTTKPAGKEDIRSRLIAAKQSTASMGAFDEKIKNDKVTGTGKKRQFKSNFSETGKEKDKNLAILSRINEGKTLVNKERAANLHKASQETQRSAKRKADDGEKQGPAWRERKKPKTQKKVKGTSKHSTNKKRK